LSSPGNSLRRDRWLAVAALLTVAAAWYLGTVWTPADLDPAFRQALPAAASFEILTSEIGAAHDPESRLVGYVHLGRADGYGGPLALAVGIDTAGAVTGVAIVEQRETPTILAKVRAAGLLESFRGAPVASEFRIGEDVDAVSGATYTVTALVENARQACRRIGVERLGRDLPPPPAPATQFGLPEIVLILLYLVGWLGLRKKLPARKWLRWLCLLVGLVILGFWLNRPFTLGFVNRLLLGYWPAWQDHLYWYLLTGGLVLFLVVDGKNPYCEWFCPFLAAQECVGAIGGAGGSLPPRHHNWLKWGHRGLAWLAVMVALIIRNPAISSYEVFGALFDFTGSRVLFVLLGLTLLTSLLFRRPWCRYLCPVSAVTALILLLRNWGRELWRTI